MVHVTHIVAAWNKFFKRSVFKNYLNILSYNWVSKFCLNDTTTWKLILVLIGQVLTNININILLRRSINNTIGIII